MKQIKVRTMYTHENYFVFKLIALGDTGTGKTTLFHSKNGVCGHTTPTIGIDFFCSSFPVSSKLNKWIKLQCWDTAGQERFRSITNSYMKNVDVCLFVFDLTREETFQNIRRWICDFDHHTQDPTSTIRVLVGNKSDQTKTIGAKIIQHFSSQYNLPYLEISALTGEGVEIVFEHICKRLIESYNLDSSKDVPEEPMHKASENSNCCHLM